MGRCGRAKLQSRLRSPGEQRQRAGRGQRTEWACDWPPHSHPQSHPVCAHPFSTPALPLQGDCLDQAAELIIKQFKDVKKADIYYIESKKKTPYFDEEDDA